MGCIGPDTDVCGPIYPWKIVELRTLVDKEGGVNL
jgi:hypothetical protein